MDIEKMLTTEALRQVKPELSAFDLVSYAINRAQTMINKGRDEGYVKTESKSRATQVLAEIANKKEFLDAFEEEEKEEEVRDFVDMKVVASDAKPEEEEPVL